FTSHARTGPPSASVCQDISVSQSLCQDSPSLLIKFDDLFLGRHPRVVLRAARFQGRVSHLGQLCFESRSPAGNNIAQAADLEGAVELHEITDERFTRLSVGGGFLRNSHGAGNGGVALG